MKFGIETIDIFLIIWLAIIFKAYFESIGYGMFGRATVNNWWGLTLRLVVSKTSKKCWYLSVTNFGGFYPMSFVLERIGLVALLVCIQREHVNVRHLSPLVEGTLGHATMSEFQSTYF